MNVMMALALVLVGAAGAFAAWRFSTTITRPLKDVVQGAQAIGWGWLKHRIPVTSRDEVGELAQSFNQMAEDLTHARADLVQAERQAAYLDVSERVLQATPMSLVVVDQESRVVTANDLFHSTFGLAKEAAQGRELAELADLGELTPAVTRTLRDSKGYQGQWKWADADGALHYFFVTISTMATAGDNATQVLMALEEITDRIATEWRYQYLMDNANDGVFVVDVATGRIVEASSMAAEMVGVTSKEELIDREVLTLHPASMSETAASHLNETLERGSTVFDDLPLKRQDGSTLEVQISARLIELGNERLIHSVVRDVSEQKAAAKALRESEERYRRLVDHSPDAILVHGEGRILYANAAAAGTFGASAPEALSGRPVMDFLADEHREFVADRIRRMYENRETVPPAEIKIVGFDGQIREVEAAGGPITYEGLPAAQVVLRDITERKQADRRLREASRLASIGELAAGVAHEINKPLTSILGYSQLLMSEDLPERALRT